MTDEFAGLYRDTDHGVMVLSTCAEGRVTSRAMSVVAIDGRFYCQTNRNYLKCRQIAANPNVSLCFGRYTIEGICSIKGHPKEDARFMDALRRVYPDAAERWSDLPEECVLEITPRLVRSWIYEDGVPYIEEWDMDERTYSRIIQQNV
ncbi:MAG: pyridoxamine 5'-phosphate oxidase family protein [Oscillospiraceae bacterium]|nr:pyridoxamine 5'-phosphate oxidase family protein [Oscillospiraceae bacterium]